MAYVAFLLFCLFSAARDVTSEAFFKDQSYASNPIFVLFVFSLVTQVVSGAILARNRTSIASLRLSIAPVKTELVYLNLFTMSAYLFYFLAISSPLGAALNTFFDYGFGPILTALVGVHLAGTHLDKRFTIAALASLAGVVILVAPRAEVEHLSLYWFVGVSFALISSLSGAYFRVYFKILLNHGLDKSAIIFLRLIGTTVALGIILAINPAWWRFDLVVPTAIVGILGFTLPLFLILSVVERVDIRGFSMLLFLVPALTLLFSGIAGYAHIFASDVAATGMMILGIAINEYRKKNEFGR